MAAEKLNTPTIFFIFGGSGDLNYRKLTPALFNLYIDDLLPQEFIIVGIARSEYLPVEYITHLKEGIENFSERKDETKWNEFAEHIKYISLDFNDHEGYQQISKEADDFKSKFEHYTAVFYMAVAPQLVPVIVPELSKLNFCKDVQCTRIVVEKPFGHNLETAKEMNRMLLNNFDEKQIYRIDHYLGKETVQNILAFRFANALFEPVWNRNYIDFVQITSSETVGVEGRGGYYENSGALRDMVQNHILQLLCMVAMEPPVSFEADEIRNKKVDVLNAIQRISKRDVQNFAVRGQYSSGWIPQEEVNGYRQEKDVAAASNVETFAAVKFFVDNWRWQHVPFYVRTGKRMKEKSTVIHIQFKPAPYYSFPDEATETWRPNRLSISIQPEMDITLRMQAKKPGQNMLLTPVNMNFNYRTEYDTYEHEAYETLLYDVLEGDATLFMRADQVEAAWEVVTPIMEVWHDRKPTDIPNYSPGSWGPEDAEALIAKDGNYWIAAPHEEKK
ncbi:glucose-6-phosphate dehydrogenase [soil metagenome]